MFLHVMALIKTQAAAVRHSAGRGVRIERLGREPTGGGCLHQLRTRLHVVVTL
jgi:hypothetical protein